MITYIFKNIKDFQLKILVNKYFNEKNDENTLEEILEILDNIKKFHVEEDCAMRKGFTLMELMVALAVAGILLALFGFFLALGFFIGFPILFRAEYENPERLLY